MLKPVIMDKKELLKIELELNDDILEIIALNETKLVTSTYI